MQLSRKGNEYYPKPFRPSNNLFIFFSFAFSPIFRLGKKLDLYHLQFVRYYKSFFIVMEIII